MHEKDGFEEGRRPCRRGAMMTYDDEAAAMTVYRVTFRASHSERSTTIHGS